MSKIDSEAKSNHSNNYLVPDKIWDSTVSLAIVHNEAELHQFGTGTLLRVGDYYFVVTAGHVVRQASENNRALLIPTNQRPFIQLQGGYCSDDGQDIGVIQLTPSNADQLHGKSFLQLLDVAFDDDLASGTFGIFGYPGRLAQPGTPNNSQMILQPFQYITYAFDGAVDALGNYDRKLHLLLKADAIAAEDSNGNAFAILDRQGSPLEFPSDLGGISGCSVWMLGSSDKSTSDLGKKYPKVVAVQTAVYPDSRIIKATRWICVSTLLWQAFPELRPVLQLSRI